MTDKIREAFEKFHAEHLRKMGMDEHDIATERDRLENGDYQWSMAAEAWPYWQAAAALAQQPVTAVPDGWKLVPAVPTQEQNDAGRAVLVGGAVPMAKVYRAMLAAAPAAPDDKTLDARLKAAGMLTATELMQGQPIDAFVKHAGVKDLATFSEWLDLKCREFLTLKARRSLEKQPEDEMYEWVFAHAAVFHEVRVNFKAATAAPAAPVAQEPVAYQVRNPRTAKVKYYGAAKRYLAEQWALGGYEVTPLYTAPPAAEQPDTVKVPRELADLIAYALHGSGWFVLNRKLRALLAGGEE